MKVLVADDHAIVRKGLKQILLDEYPFGEIEECANAEELVQKANDGKWDVIISDISMPGRSGLEALHQIRSSHPPPAGTHFKHASRRAVCYPRIKSRRIRLLQ